jgi:subtilisin family serine protease
MTIIDIVLNNIILILSVRGGGNMWKKIVGILICTLLIITAIQTLATINKNIIPNDPDFNKQWYLDNTGQTGGTIDADIDAPEAWQIETGDTDVIVAIIDSGIDYTHPDLAERIWINEDEIPDNEVDDDNNGYVDDIHGFNFLGDNNNILDAHGHGTMISGAIGAVTNNNIGIACINWNCSIMILKIWDTNVWTEMHIENVIEAIEYAVNNGADIISMSFGVTENSLTTDEMNMGKAAIDGAFNNGCVLVSSAGNDGFDTPYYPGAWDHVICVGGTDDNDEILDYPPLNIKSNYGDWVDVAAPAELIMTTAPTYQSMVNGLDYIYGVGTSIAGPEVAALAALIKSRNPSLSPGEIMDIIITNVDPYDSEYYLGSGRINAYKSLVSCNRAPERPDSPSGETSGKVGVEYVFTTSSTDVNNDPIFYKWDWGDGEYSDWLESNSTSHVWEQQNTYSVRVKAKDNYGAESEWSNPLLVTMPKIKVINIPLILQRFFQHFPFMVKILNQILL